MAQKPLLLVCNDDDITAPGIEALVAVAKEFGEVWVVAPNAPQSGTGHAITIGNPIRLYPYHFPVQGVQAYACSGTPVDCVKLATGVVLKRKPTLILSGINHGANTSISVFYSGTMSAAIEGAIEGIPSIGFSLCNYDPAADLSAAKEVVRRLIDTALKHPLPPHTALNVNIPYLPLSEIKGIKITRQAMGRFIEEFEERTDPYGRPYYWLTGKFYSEDNGQDTDIWAIANGYVSVCPVLLDLTHNEMRKQLHSWEKSVL